MNLPLRRTHLSRETPFLFSCSQCLSCCYHKKIQVNPYEITSLARNRGLSTTEFLERYTHDSGTVLNWEESGACVFLDSKGCSVHPDRPLVCRLYPLGRHVLPSGEECFSEIEPDNGCKGIYSEASTINNYLDAQGARPFMNSADNYLDLFWRLYRILEEEVFESEKENTVASVFHDYAIDQHNRDIGFADVDAIVTAFCEKLSLQVPDTIDEKISIHLQAVEAWANTTKKKETKNAEKKARHVKKKGPGEKIPKASYKCF
jgi:uncharacterized protein